MPVLSMPSDPDEESSDPLAGFTELPPLLVAELGELELQLYKTKLHLLYERKKSRSMEKQLKRPLGYAEGSKAGYYDEKYAKETKIIVDRFLTLPEGKKLRIDAAHFRISIISAIMRYQQGLAYLVDFLDTPQKKYADIQNKITFCKCKETGGLLIKWKNGVITEEGFDFEVLDDEEKGKNIVGKNSKRLTEEEIRSRIDDWVIGSAPSLKLLGPFTPEIVLSIQELISDLENTMELVGMVNKDRIMLARGKPKLNVEGQQ